MYVCCMNILSRIRSVSHSVIYNEGKITIISQILGSFLIVLISYFVGKHLIDVTIPAICDIAIIIVFVFACIIHNVNDSHMEISGLVACGFLIVIFSLILFIIPFKNMTKTVIIKPENIVHLRSSVILVHDNEII